MIDKDNSKEPEQNFDESDSALADLFDFRVVMFLICVIVIAMTATVLLLQDDVEMTAEQKAAAAHAIESKQEGDDSAIASVDASGERNSVDANVKAQSQVTSDTSGPTKAVSSAQSVRQKADNSFSLPARLALLSDCDLDSNSIAKWETDSFAQWEIEIADRRSGFFYLQITYQARFESQFAIQMGGRNPINFTIYPQPSDFTEKVIVRLGKANSHAVKLIAKQVDLVAGVQIKKVELIPQN